MLFMIIERFKDQNLKSVYRRFREQGRMMPEGANFTEVGWSPAAVDASSLWNATTCGT
jgi:hypothetical protein